MADIRFEVVIGGDTQLVNELKKYPSLPVPAVIDDALVAGLFDQSRDALAIDVLMTVHRVDLELAVCRKFLKARGIIEKPIRLTREDFEY